MLNVSHQYRAGGGPDVRTILSPNQRGSLTGTAKVQACWVRSPFNANALTRFSRLVREAVSGKDLLRKCVDVFPSILPNSRCTVSNSPLCSTITISPKPVVVLLTLVFVLSSPRLPGEILSMLGLQSAMGRHECSPLLVVDEARRYEDTILATGNQHS